MRAVQLLTNFLTLTGLVVGSQIARADQFCAGSCSFDGLAVSGFIGEITGSLSGGISFTSLGPNGFGVSVIAPYHWSIDMTNVSLSEEYTMPNQEFGQIGVFFAVSAFGPDGQPEGSLSDMGNAGLGLWGPCLDCIYSDLPLGFECLFCVASSAELGGQTINGITGADVLSLTISGLSAGYCDAVTGNCPGSFDPPAIFTPEPGSLALLATVIAGIGCALRRSKLKVRQVKGGF